MPARDARSLRLLFVTPRYFPELSGVAISVHEVARRLVRAGVDTTVVTTDPSGRLAPSDEIDHVRIRRVRAWPAQSDLCIAPGVARIIRREAWDLVHVQSYQTFVAPLAMWAARRAAIPYLVTFHGGGHSSRLRHAIRPVQLRVLGPLLAGADRLIAVARFEIPLFTEMFGLPADRFFYSPNGSDITVQPHVHATVPDPSLVMSVGRLEKYKGHHRVIEALPHVLGRRPDVRLHVLGFGPYEGKLRALATQLGVGERVEINGIPPLELHRVGECLARAAVVVSLSEYETHPLSVLNALAFGRPVIVSDSSGLAELAQVVGAPTVPLDGSPQDVAATILKVLEQPPTTRAINLPTWDNCAAELHALYVSILERRTPH